MGDPAIRRQTSSKPIHWDHLVTVVWSQNTRHFSYGLLVLIVLGNTDHRTLYISSHTILLYLNNMYVHVYYNRNAMCVEEVV